MQKKKIFSLIVIFDLFFTSSLFAATITLKSGKVIEAEILEETKDYIKVDYNGTPVYYERKYITNITLDTPTETIQTDLEKALSYASQAKFKEAEAECKKGLQRNPSNRNLEEILALLEDLKTGKINEKYAIYLFKGSNYLIKEEYQSAIKEFQEALNLKPDDPDIFYYLGICYYGLAEYQDAISYLKKAVAQKPDAEFYFYLGSSYYSEGDYPQAIESLKKVLEIDPKDADAYGILAVCNRLLGDSQQAQENFQKAKELLQKQGDFLKAQELEDFLVSLQ